MKLWFLLTLFSIWCTGSTAFSTWTQRMQKYGSLVNCEYYLTSEDQYRDDFSLDEIANKTVNGFAYQLHYFVLTKNSTKLRLQQISDSSTTDAFSATRAFDLLNTTPEYINYGYETTTDPPPPPKYPLSPKNPTYEIIIGDMVKFERGYRNNYNGYQEAIVERTTETYIKDSNLGIVKSVVTPNIIQSDEPTEINVDVYKNGILKLYVNKIITLIVRVKDLTSATHVSFASAQNKERQEIFYNCNT